VYKRFLSILFLLILVIGLLGCSKDKVTSKTGINYDSSGVYKKIFSEGESKELNLGILALGESAIVAISPLDFNPDSSNLFFGNIEVDFKLDKNSNIVSIPAENIKKSNKRDVIEKESKSNNNSEQEQMDISMRQIEDKLFKDYGVSKLLNNSVSIQSLAYQVGDQKEFKMADNYNQANPPTVTATVQKVSDYAYIFVDENVSISSAKLDAFADEFDNQIFPTDTKYFANHDYFTGGYDIDSNQKVIILITELDTDPSDGTLMGYFAPWDVYSSSEITASNEADMFYINSWAINNMELKQTLGTLAHEFQHLLFFIEKKFYANRELTDTWINEGFSGLAEYLNGYYSYSGDRRIIDSIGDRGYFNYPQGESLVYWNNQLSDYGASNLFAFYLYKRFGIGIIKDIISSSKSPIEVISNNYGDFTGLFLDWMITNYITDDSNNSFNNYNYPFALEYYPAYATLDQYTTSDSFLIKSTGVKYYKIDGSGVETSLIISLPKRTGVVIYKTTN
jgi:hypothetical protein